MPPLPSFRLEQPYARSALKRAWCESSTVAKEWYEVLGDRAHGCQRRKCLARTHGRGIRKACERQGGSQHRKLDRERRVARQEERGCAT